jgi:hypothetical protein
MHVQFVTDGLDEADFKVIASQETITIAVDLSHTSDQHRRNHGSFLSEQVPIR